MKTNLRSLKSDAGRRFVFTIVFAVAGYATLQPLSRVFAAADAIPASLTPLEKKADETIIPFLDFTAMTPAEALKSIARETGIKVIYTPEGEERASLPFRVTKVSAAKALYMVAQFSHLELTYASDGVHCQVKPVVAGASKLIEMDTVFGIKQQWQSPFLAAYKLPAEALIRRIPPPFIAERSDFLHESTHDPKMCADWLGLVQTGDKVRTGGMGSEKHSLRGVLRHIIRLKPWEIDGADALLDFPLEGDWTVREGTKTEQLLHGLEGVLLKTTGRQLRFEPRTVERLVVVARSPAVKTEPDLRKIEIYANDSSDTKLQVGSGDFRAFLAQVGDCLEMAAFDEASAELREMTWRPHRDAYASLMKERREQLTAKVLENLSAQTGLSFTTERRALQAWQVVEGK